MAVKVIFKNVGQGDTIIIEAKLKDKYRIAIIDCKLTWDKRNVVVEYLESLKKPFEIEFVALSHPHEDHYEGMETLFDYFAENGILQNRVYDTYWFKETIFENNGIELTKAYVDSFEKYVKKLEFLIENELIREQTSMHSGMGLIFDYPTLDIVCFAPPRKFQNAILKKTKEDIDKHKLQDGNIPKFSKNANHHSSILKICKSDCKEYILLTSDAEKEMFELLMDVKLLGFSFWNRGNQEMIAGQIPHHGSFKNYHEPFWEKVKSRSPNPTAVISVGDNPYEHPSKQVADSLRNIGFKHLNITGDLEKMRTDKKTFDHDDEFISHGLDYISCLNYKSKNDKKFDI